MERCPNCGNKLSKIDVLCPRCGSVVEVIQIKGNISVASEAVANGRSNNDIPVKKKEFPQNFIVYNEDFPTEDSGDIEPEAMSDMPFSDTSENTEVLNAPSEPGNDIDFNLDQEPVNSIRAKLLEKTLEEENSLQEDNSVSAEANSILAEKHDPELSAEEDNDYSPRYLEKIKNLNLPEIEDINNFDPEEYMREYKYRKIVKNKTEADVPAAPVKKQWLEIEEADSLAAGLESVREDVLMQPQPDTQPSEQPIQRRYKGAQESRTAIKESRAEIQESRAAIKKDYINTERKQPSVKNKKRVKYSAFSTVLFWIIVSAVILFSCIFFDNYVKSSFGTYDSFIYSITNGQIDIDPGKP